ncbi:MAG: pyridoxine 5'-phosphate synthase [Brevinematales bacterium]|nr:pyridoxine 5'-phosphate synthase [Brevinematales bacterium]
MIKKLGLNIDHVATLREARKAIYPDPIYAAVIAEIAGVDGITAHLREDRRHIKDRDIRLLRQIVKTSLNLEMSLNDEIIKIALDVKPDEICIVPENRMEITTEGGLDVQKNKLKLSEIIPEFNKIGTKVSIFIDPDNKQIEKAKEVMATYIELNTGKYSEAKTENEIYTELQKLKEATSFATSIGLRVNAGHGLNYKNVKEIVNIEAIETLNIGHSIISYSVYVGLERAIKEMLDLIKRG